MQSAVESGWHSQQVTAPRSADHGKAHVARAGHVIQWPGLHPGDLAVRGQDTFPAATLASWRSGTGGASPGTPETGRRTGPSGCSTTRAGTPSPRWAWWAGSRWQGWRRRRCGGDGAAVAARRARPDPADRPGDQTAPHRPHHPGRCPVAHHPLGHPDPPPPSPRTLVPQTVPARPQRRDRPGQPVKCGVLRGDAMVTRYREDETRDLACPRSGLMTASVGFWAHRSVDRLAPTPRTNRSPPSAHFSSPGSAAVLRRPSQVPVRGAAMRSAGSPAFVGWKVHHGQRCPPASLLRMALRRS